jgi:hypothetical protein
MRREQWTIGIVAQSAESLVREGLRAPIRWLKSSRRGFLADPFALPLPDRRLLVLAEWLPYRTFHGEIVGAVATTETLQTTSFRPLLQGAAHLSYPQLIRWDGRWLLFCEAWETGSLSVFAAADPMGPWRRATQLLPGVPAVDPTVVEHDGRWYLFLTSQRDGPNRRLRLYHGDTPLGPWLPHAREIVVDDPSSARPAGPLFRLSDGTLVRPSQDCSLTYGGAVNLFRVDRLSPEAYGETLLRRIEPPPGKWGQGLHSLCPIDETSCLIDAKRWLPAPLDPLRAPLRAVMTRLRRRRAREPFL